MAHWVSKQQVIKDFCSFLVTFYTLVLYNQLFSRAFNFALPVKWNFDSISWSPLAWNIPAFMNVLRGNCFHVCDVIAKIRSTRIEHIQYIILLPHQNISHAILQYCPLISREILLDWAYNNIIFWYSQGCLELGIRRQHPGHQSRCPCLPESCAFHMSVRLIGLLDGTLYFYRSVIVNLEFRARCWLNVWQSSWNCWYCSRRKLGYRDHTVAIVNSRCITDLLGRRKKSVILGLHIENFIWEVL